MRLDEVKGLRRNPDGSFEGHVDAETANKLLAEASMRGTLSAIAAVKAKDERVKKMLDAEKKEGGDHA